MRVLILYFLSFTRAGFRDEPIENNGIRTRASCPIDCSCADISKAVCGAKGLTHIPLSQKSSRINYLWLPDNRIDNIDDYSFLNWANLQTLCLRNNSLHYTNSISERAFRSLKKLKFLYLAANDIETVDFWLPSSVQMVELGNNKIEKIGKHVFRRAKNLEKLYLHGNWLNETGIPSMRRLKKLEELVLSNNYLQKIPKMARNVERIDLHFNKFSGILSRKSLSSLRNLRELYLQDNKITKLAPNALSRTPIEYLHIGNNLLEVMPQGLPKTIKVLKLENNRLKVFSASSVAKLENLAVLEIYGNSLHIIDGSLRNVKLPLIHLRLHNNNFSQFPETLPQSVKTLVLMNNNIHSISKRALKGFSQMTSLNLAGNQLKSREVQGGAFRQSRQLEEIDLHENDLHRIPSLPKTLMKLNLAANRIEKLDKDRLMRLTRLKYLNLNDNLISRFPLELFVRNKDLETLMLSGNKLTSVPKMLPCSLKKIDLSYNLITDISLGTFVGCQILEEIDLRNNILVSSAVDSNAFGVLRRLIQLHITWNDEAYEAYVAENRKKKRSKLTQEAEDKPKYKPLVPAD